MCTVLYVNCISIKLQENRKKKKDMHIKFKSLLIYVVSESVGKQVLLYSAGGNANATTSIERNLTICSQTTNVFNLWPSNPTSKNLYQTYIDRNTKQRLYKNSLWKRYLQ